MTSEEYEALPLDESNLAVPCPKCGQPGAYIASMRCPACGRGIANTPGLMGTAYECPHCKAPLGGAAPPPD